tara:strand:+ start:219 stop:521 length:303 start_codon:yes stop_codon:yes gene_type:complete
MLSIIKKNYITLITTFLILYFLFNLFDGERGLISFFKKDKIIYELKKEEEILINKIDDLSNRNNLLTIKKDLDFIEILIRDKFIFGKNGEKIYMLHNDKN